MIPIFRRYLADLKPGPVDHELVWRYLRLERPEDLAIIAAPMAPRDEGFDPEQLVKKSLALLKAAESAFLEQQKQLLERMNSNTLLELNNQINGKFDHDITSENDPTRPYDIVASSLVHHLRKIREAMPVEFWRKENERIEKALSKVAKSKPPLPCSLEKAIRYATNEIKASWEALEGAFIDRLAIWLIDTAIVKDSRPGIRAFTNLPDAAQPKTEERIQTAKEPTIADTEAPPEAPDPRPSREDRLATLRELKTSFKPMWQAPTEVASDARDLYSGLLRITNKGQLAWLVEDFSSFWQNYRTIYVDHFEQASLQRSTIKAAKRRGAESSNKSREENKWKTVTETFCKHLQRQLKYPQTVDELDLAINEFVYGNHLPANTSKSTARRFLSAMWSAANTPAKSSSTLKKLVKETGFKSVKSAFLAECLKTFLALIAKVTADEVGVTETERKKLG